MKVKQGSGVENGGTHGFYHGEQGISLRGGGGIPKTIPKSS